MVSLWRRMLVCLLPSPVSAVLLLFQVLNLPVKPKLVIAVTAGLVASLVFLVLGLGCWKTGINVLRNEVQLLTLSLGNAVEIRLF